MTVHAPWCTVEHSGPCPAEGDYDAVCAQRDEYKRQRDDWFKATEGWKSRALLAEQHNKLLQNRIDAALTLIVQMMNTVHWSRLKAIYVALHSEER